MSLLPKSGPLRLVALLAFALVLLAGLAWAVVAVLFPPPRVRALVEQQLAQTLDRPVRFEGAAIGIFPRVALAVRGVAIAEPGGFDNGTAFQAPAIGLDLDVLALLGRKLRVERLVLDRPTLHLVIHPDGTTNFDRMMKPAPPGVAGAAAKPMDLDIARLEIREARVILDRVASQKRTAFELGTRLSFSSTGGGARLATAGHTTVTGLAIGPLTATRMADLNQSLGKLVWTLDHEGVYEASTKRLALGKLALAFGRTSVELQGRVDELGAAPVVDLRTRGERVDLGEVLRAVSVADARAVNGISGAGELSFDFTIRGRMAPGRTPAVTGTLGVRKGSFRYAGAPASVENLSFDARFAPDSLGIPNVEARVANQPVRGMLEVRQFGDPRVRFALRGNVDLAAVAPMFAPKDTKLSGHADVDVGGAGRAKDLGSFALTGRAKLANVRVASPQTPKPIEKLNGELSFSNQRATVRGLTFEAGTSSLAFDGTVTRPLALMKKPGEAPPSNVDFTLRSPRLDLAELLPAGGGGPLIANATGGGTVTIGRLLNQKLDVTNVSARVTLEPAVMAVPSFGFDGYGGTVRGSGRFDFRDAKTPVVKLDAAMDTVKADALLSVWTPAKGLLRGAMSTTLALSVTGSTPEEIKRSISAAGLAAIANGSLGPGPVLEAIAAATRIPKLKETRFRDARIPFRVEHGRVVTDPVRISGPYGDWQFIGAIGFDGALDYALSITLPADVSEQLGARSSLAAGALADKDGRILLDLRVGGTAKAPKVSLDGKAMQARLAGRASEAIQEQRERLEQSLVDRLTGGGTSSTDSLRARGDSLRRAAEDSLKRAAKNVIEGFLRPKKKSAAPADTVTK